MSGTGILDCCEVVFVPVSLVGGVTVVSSFCVLFHMQETCNLSHTFLILVSSDQKLVPSDGFG